MSAAQFDTLRYVETLTSAGVPEPQAKAGVAALTRAFDEWGSGFLATKSDIFDVKSEIAALRAEIAGVRAELKGDTAALRTELKGEIAELKGEIADVKSDLKLVKWANLTLLTVALTYVARSFF